MGTRFKIAVCGLAALLLSVQCRGIGLNREQEALAGFRKTHDEYAAVTIALIDTGVAVDRLDSEKILAGKSYVSEDETDTRDLVGHGTRIASLILGATDGEAHITPLAENARIVPLVYYSQYPSGVAKNGGVEAICQGVYDAVDRFSVGVIVISSGIYEDDPALAACVAYAEEKDVIVISAAGNDGDEALVYPAAYDTVVSVGSVDNEMRVSSFSQNNAHITVMAPGENLWAVSLRNGDFFESVNGTSYSCAYVAALASRLLGMYPDMKPADFRGVLEKSSTALSMSEHEAERDCGVLNAEAAIRLYGDLVQWEGGRAHGTFVRRTVRSQCADPIPHLREKTHYVMAW